ncbi:MAG TPA: hypothetical protein PKN48_00140 [Bacteroidales bacterium]|nr:hypothetical protein [Bacteroidales bacterium]
MEIVIVNDLSAEFQRIKQKYCPDISALASLIKEKGKYWKMPGNRMAKILYPYSDNSQRVVVEIVNFVKRKDGTISEATFQMRTLQVDEVLRHGIRSNKKDYKNLKKQVLLILGV